jgi:CHASE1-domain containing sensor protein
MSLRLTIFYRAYACRSPKLSPPHALRVHSNSQLLQLLLLLLPVIAGAVVVVAVVISFITFNIIIT